MLTHYTREISALANILEHGFAWFPNRRRLVEQLIPMHASTEREPQQFGMVSFTDLRPHEAGAHTAKFGHLGIAVADSWARAHNVQRVVYVDAQGPVVEALAALFRIGHEDLTARIRHPDDAGWNMAFENRAVAGSVAGSILWANLLTLWEYLEPVSSAFQREWRIVNPHPLYSLSENKMETVANVSPPVGWAKHLSVIPIGPEHVDAIVCPAEMKSEVRAELPAKYSDVPIIEVHA